MKAKDKPKYISELRKIISQIDIEQLVKQPHHALSNQGILRAKAIFTNFDFGMGEELQVLIDDILESSRLGDVKHIGHFAGNIQNFIIQKTEEMDVYEIIDKKGEELTYSKDRENSFLKVFIVHGHDEQARETVARFVEKLGLEAIILHEQPNAGRTIIEKFEDYSNVQFAIVLLTPDDVGKGSSETELNPRARQNVIFELGFFIGKLTRKNVCALYKEEVEILSDYQGVLYHPLDSGGGWKLALAKELKAAGFNIDMNRVL